MGDVKSGNIELDLLSKHSKILAHCTSPKYHTELKEWSLNSGIYNYDEEDIKRGEHYICFNVADYIKWLWLDGKECNSPVIDVNCSELSKQRGVFQCDSENNIESHSFVLWINDMGQMRYYSGYGGHKRFIYHDNITLNFEQINDCSSLEEKKLHVQKFLGIHDDLFHRIYDRYENITFDLNISTQKII